MRIITKVNLALMGVVAVSAVLNLAALELTVTPSFRQLETQAAERNQSRAIEAIQTQEDQVAASSRDYAFWDDSYAFMNSGPSEYESKNLGAQSFQALSVNYFVAIDRSGFVKLDKGFDFSGEEPAPLKLLRSDRLPANHPLRQPFAGAGSRSGLVRTEKGLAAVGYAPILTSERGGESKGTLLFGKLLDIDALRSTTKVDFDLLPVEADVSLNEGVERGPDAVKARTVLKGIDGKPVAVVVSKTGLSISLAGSRAIWAAMALLFLGGLFLIGTLAFAIRRIAVRRIEAMQKHLVTVASTGALDPIPADGRGDELSETVASFNHMAAQLGELREKLRRQDYSHGAADQAAGILHNVRNAISPIGTIAWDLAQAEGASWKQNFVKAVQQLGESGIEPARAAKLNQFVALSAARLLEEGDKRKADLETLGAMVRHVDRILKDEDAVSQSDRVIEAIDLGACAPQVSKMVHGRAGIAFVADLPANAIVLGQKIVFEQVLGNLLVNAAEAIEATGKGSGTVSLSVRQIQHAGLPAFDILVRDDGDGIPADRLEKIFEKGFSTRRERSSGIGLHWCANAVNAMNGRLYAESEGTGRGATLHLVLPRAVAELKEAA